MKKFFEVAAAVMLCASLLVSCGSNDGSTASSKSGKAAVSEQSGTVSESTSPDAAATKTAESKSAGNAADAASDNVYDEVLKTYRNAQTNNYFNGDPDSCGDINMELWYSADRTSKLQYALIDLANDGKPELIIAKPDSTYSTGYIIYDMWGQSNGKAVRLFDLTSMGYRSIYTVCENGAIKNAGSSGAGSNSYEVYTIAKNSAKPVIKESYQQEGTSYTKYEGTSDKGTKITSEEFDNAINICKDMKNINWVNV